MQDSTLIGIALFLVLGLIYHFTDKPSASNRIWYDRLPRLHRYLYFDLCSLQGDSVIHHTIEYGIEKSEMAGNDLGFYETVEFIYSQGSDNPSVMIEVVGQEIWEAVVQMKEGELRVMKQHLQLN